MKLSRKDLENISWGRFSKIGHWRSKDQDPGRIIIPTWPLLFIDEVLDIQKDPAKIVYRCKSLNNPLFQKLSFGFMIEFFQGYMILADFLGLGKLPEGVSEFIHRALGGKVTYHSRDFDINSHFEIEVELKKTLNLGKTRIITYKGAMKVKNKLILELDEFKAVFFDPRSNRKPTNQDIICTKGELEDVKDFFIDEQIQTFHKFSSSGDFLNASYKVSENDWFFHSHFIRDPCMPGSFVFQGIFDILEFYKGKGYPMLNSCIQTIAKQNVLPEDQELIYECKVKEETEHQIFVDVNVSVDGKLAFCCENFGYETSRF